MTLLYVAAGAICSCVLAARAACYLRVLLGLWTLWLLYSRIIARRRTLWCYVVMRSVVISRVAYCVAMVAIGRITVVLRPMRLHLRLAVIVVLRSLTVV